MSQRGKTIGKIKCWEVFQCKEEECPAYKSKNLMCWFLSDGRYRNEIQGKFIEKMEMCLGCKVFRTNINVTTMEKTIKFINKQFEESVEKYKTLAESSLTGMFIHQDGLFIFVNDRFAEIHAYKPEELIGRNHLSLIHPDEREALKDIVSKRLRGETVPQRYEIRRIRKDGKTIWCEMMATRIQYRGRPTIMGNIIDITERIRAQDAIRKSERFLNTIFESINDPFNILDRDYRIIKANNSYARMRGKTVEELIGRHCYEVLYNRNNVCEGCSVKETFDSGKPYIKEKRVSFSGGPHVWIEIYTYPIFDERQNVSNVIEYTRDITKRKQIEEVLRQSESKYRTLLENLPQKIYLKDSDSVYVSCNDNYARDLMIKSDEIVGKTDYDFYPIELADKYRADDKRIMESGQTEDIEEKYIQDGQEVIIHTVKTPIRDGEGTVIGILGFFWDITLRKKMEEQMFQTEKLASIGTLAAGVAHEINNPLAIMLGFTEVLLEKVPQDSEFNDLLKTIQKHGNNAKRIVENLLNFARFKECKKEEVDISKCIESVIDIEGKRLSLNNISVKKDMEESLPIVKGDPDELQQVFFNIINNAASSMKGGGDLRIQTKFEDNRKNIEIKISDTGTGIKPEHRSRIFDPLFTTKKRGEGTGLGLTVSYAIVKKYAGEITFETRTKEESPKSGTTFIITLPTINEPSMPGGEKEGEYSKWMIKFF
jgi:PAS domain S-box-containing protein